MDLKTLILQVILIFWHPRCMLVFRPLYLAFIFHGIVL